MPNPQEISVAVGDGGASAARTYPAPGGEEAIAKYMDLNSLYGLFSRTASQFGDLDVFGHRPVPGNGDYEFITYSEAASLITRLATALISVHGLEKGDRVGIYGKNCPAWVIIQYAVNAAGGVIVPIYDTLGEDIVQYVCNHAQVKVVFVANDNYPKWEIARPECPTVEVVVHFDIGAYDSRDGKGTVSELISRGTESSEALPEVSSADLFVIMYTSGTTGNPKGVMLTNGNFLASVGSVLMWLDDYQVPYERTDVYYSFLPLSHIMEQQQHACLISAAGKIGFYSGNIKLLLSDLSALKPTKFVGVPRVYAKFQQKIEEAVAAGSSMKQYLFNWAYNRQLSAVKCDDNTIGRNYLWDYLVMGSIKAKLLPSVKMAITGSAPMSVQTNDFLKVVLNCPVMQGYGLTETVGGIAITPPTSRSGTLGGPLPGVEIKLIDIPEMDYLSENSQGEIAIRGKMVSNGYYRNEEATAMAFIEDGWFLTGDVGQWNDDGSLQIIDRKKNLFKLSQGEYVSPDLLEQEYAKAPLVMQIFVYGNSLASCLVAVVAPDVPNTLQWWKQLTGKTVETIDSIVDEEETTFKTEILRQLLGIQKAFGFNSYEKIQDIIIENEDRNEIGQCFHVDNNLATPTFKLKRPQLTKKYKERLDALYGTMEEI